MTRILKLDRAFCYVLSKIWQFLVLLIQICMLWIFLIMLLDFSFPVRPKTFVILSTND